MSRYHSTFVALSITVIVCINRAQAQNPASLPAPYNSAAQANYVRTWDALAPEQDTVALKSRPLRDVCQTTAYYDGLGRSLQTVIKQGSYPSGGTAVDMVAPVVYDSYGRETFRYMPFGATATDGSQSNGDFKLNPFQQQAAFYNTQLAGQAGETNVGPENSNWAYGKINYGPITQSRINSGYVPGTNWVGSELSSNAANRHGIQNRYLVNTAADDVKSWTVNSVSADWGTYSISGTYAAGALYKNVTTDEKGIQTIEYKNQEGLVLLKKVQLTASADDGSGNGYTGWLSTYYIYDDLNRIRCVIQPRGVELLMQSGWDVTAFNNNSNNILGEQCFRFTYDGRNRLIMKKVPGAGAIFLVYDTHDRAVFYQDANLRAKGQWQTTLYDALDRPVINGIITFSASLSSLQQQVTAQTTVDNTQPAPVTVIDGQNIDKSPLPANVALTALTTTYYDDYSGIAAAGGASYNSKDNSYDGYLAAVSNSWPYPLAATQSNATYGLVTGKKIMVLNSSTSQYLYSASFYDDKGRAIQTKNSNISGGLDINTIQYSFSGKVLIAVQEKQQAGTAPQTNLVLSQMTYDDLGRLIKTEKKFSNSLINNGNLPAAWITTAENKYDALGQLKTKNLGRQKDASGAYTSTSITALTYDYNVRGWLLGINKSYVGTGDVSVFYFGMELNYDKDGYNTNTNKQYNGNVGSMIWRSQGDGVNRLYQYAYDNVNRLLKADFAQQESSGWSNTIMNFSVKMGDGADPLSAYDANGNILRMQQWGFNGVTSMQVDDLMYTYYTNSNRLQNVQDARNDTLTQLGDFRTAALHPQYTAKQSATTQTALNAIVDYTYDANGNMVRDYNKNIGDIATDGIQYNYLNLPAVITTKNKGTITFVYDAAGNKLQKITAENNVAVVYNSATYTSTVTTTTTYDNGLVFESKSYSNPALSNLQYTNKLQFLSQEDGRIRALYENAATPTTPTNVAYDYFIKDHIGNVRMVLTDEQQKDVYPVADFEDTSVAKASMYYENINVQRTTRPGAFDINTTNGGKVQLLQKNTQSIGAGKLLKVMAGDKVHARVDYYIPSATTDNSAANGLTSVLGSLIAILNGTGAPGAVHGRGTALTSALNGDAAFTGFLSLQNAGTPTTTPKAYLNILFFDDQFKFVQQSSELVPLTTEGTPQTAYRVGGNAKQAVKNGYAYVYLSNESNNLVYFDNLQVMDERGPVLEETHYYPFGLTMAGISHKALKTSYAENKDKYNEGTELQSGEFSDGSGLELYATTFRSYDPQIGRFHQSDPLTTYSASFSTYAYCFNNPLRYADPSGLITGDELNKIVNDLMNSEYGGHWNAGGSGGNGHTYIYQSEEEAFSEGASDAYLSGFFGTGQDAKDGFNDAQQRYNGMVGASHQVKLLTPVVAYGNYKNGRWVTSNIVGLTAQFGYGDGDDNEDENDANNNDDDHLKGGSQKQRDRDIKQYPKDFQRWYHREVKPDVHPGRNATPEELEEGYQDWLDLGKPVVKAVATAGFWTLVGIGAYETIKWGAAIILAPETFGASLGTAAALP